jgi:uncharacterized protein YcbK (DUF882 family)
MTKNFKLKEFKCKDGSKMPIDVYGNVVKLAGQLQILRDYLDRPITINSAYRSPKHNAKIGGSKTSQHLLGKAADITVKGLTPQEVFIVIEDLIDRGLMLQGGLGLYDTFVHYDIRKTRARWNYKKK